MIEGMLITALTKPRDLSTCDNPDIVRKMHGLALSHISAVGAVPSPRLIAMGITDLNTANVLWDDQLGRLVDFEDGGLTEPAVELADHVENDAPTSLGWFELVDRVAVAGPEVHELFPCRGELDAVTAEALRDAVGDVSLHCLRWAGYGGNLQTKPPALVYQNEYAHTALRKAGGVYRCRT